MQNDMAPSNVIKCYVNLHLGLERLGPGTKHKSKGEGLSQAFQDKARKVG